MNFDLPRLVTEKTKEVAVQNGLPSVEMFSISLCITIEKVKERVKLKKKKKRWRVELNIIFLVIIKI